MTELMASTEPPTAESPTHRPHRHAFDHALAALVVVSVLGNFVISHRLVDVHTRSTALASEIAELGRLAHEIDEPGNDVFSSHDVVRERERLDAMVPRFDAALARIASASYLATTDVETTREAMQALVSLARQVLDRVAAGDLSQAAALMAAMDRANAGLATVLAGIAGDLAERDVAGARRYQTIEGIVGVLLLALTGNAIVRSQRLARRVLVAEQAMERRAAELEDARLEALEAARAKADFLANMSHEIRTPLNAVIGMTSILTGTALDPEQRDSVETIRSSGEHLLSVINDILDFSKIEAGKLDLERTPVELRACFEESMDLVSHQAAEKGLELAASVDPSCPESIWGDAGRLRQVLVNLLGNAVKFTSAGSVLLRARADHDAPGEYRLHIAIEDSGVGIPADRIERLFQSFTQVDASTTRRFGGTGLGLAIVRRLVEQMCGRVWVESELGRGSTFHVQLRVAEASKIERHGDFQRPSALLERRALVVDDHPVNRQILQSHLRGWGMVVECAASVTAALAQIETSGPFDVVLTDHRMPERDGFDLALAIGTLGLARRPRIVLSSSSAYSKAEITRRGIAIDGYLAKPVKRAQLFDLLVRLVGDAAEQPCEPQPVASIDLLLGERYPLRILLAEDNPVNQKVALGLLTKLGYRADVAADGLEVLSALERQSYDVLLLDVNMPRLDGLATVRRIREHWLAGARPHVIAMTAEALAGDRERCLSAGMDDYVSKPVRIEDLADALLRGAKHRGTAELTTAATTPADPAPALAASSAEQSELLCPADLETLHDAVGDEVADKIVSDYVESSVGWLSDLAYAIRTNDLDRARRLAHDLKSTSRLVGAIHAASLAGELEVRARSGALGDPQPVLCDLERVLAATHSQLLAARPAEARAVPAPDPNALSLSLADPPSDTARRRDPASATPRAA